MKGSKTLAKTRDTLLSAMQEELERCFDGFKKRSKELDLIEPYFMAFNVRQKWFTNIIASNGTLMDTSPPPYEREGRVEVRVGNYEFDGFGSDATPFPYDQFGDRGAGLKALKLSSRQKLWLLAENAFNFAVKNYHQKRKDKVTEFRRKILIPDFTIETAGRHIDIEEICEIKVPTQKWDLLLRDVSKQLYEVKEAFNSEVSLHFEKSDYYHVDTEGRKLVHQEPYFHLDMTVYGRGIDKERNDDGTEIKARKYYYARTLESLPSKEKVLEDAKTLKKELKSLRRAPLLVELRERRPTVCPAILYPGMFGTYIHEALGHRLEPIRKGYKEVSNNPLEGLMGHKIMPEFLSIDFDPTIAEFPTGSGQIPNGHYKFDAEGIKAKRVAVIEKGKLVNYLTTRTPVYDPVSGKKFLKSNGHARLEGLIDGEGNAIDPIPRMSTMHIISEKRFSYDTLKKMAAEECKKKGLEYYVELELGHEGYTITEGEDGMFGIDMGKEMQFSYSRPSKTYLVDAFNGKKTLIRGVGMIKIPFEALQSIMATDNNYELSNGECGSTSGWVHVSEISPKALVRQVTLVPIETRGSPFILLPP